MPSTYDEVLPPKMTLNIKGTETDVIQADPAAPQPTFPYLQHVNRINSYNYYYKLFMGDHFSAFNIRIDDKQFNKAYAKLRYVQANYAGLISKVIADMLFSEPIIISTDDGDEDFMEALWSENNMDTQCYESALSNSALGDAVFKLRVGPRNPGDEKSTVIIEDITPKIWYPKVNAFNVRSEPEEQELAWVFEKGGQLYLRREIHSPGKIENKVFAMKADKVMAEVDISILGEEGLEKTVDTGIDQSLLVHVPNWKVGERFYGISDYYDLDPIFYAINNRMTMIDNILDKHSDPILMVPPGVMKKDGTINKKALGIVEWTEDQGKPEYIVWDASLENAMKEVEKLTEMMYLIGEISPDMLGMGEGVSDSGRALKFKVMRTLAKAARKKIYYNMALRKVMYIAQLLAKEHNLEVGGLKLKGEPTEPDFTWADGLPADMTELIDAEIKKVDAGLQSKSDAIQKIDEIDAEAAEEKLKAIEDEKPDLPMMNMGQVTPPFGKKPVPGKMKKEVDDEKLPNKEIK